MSAPYYADDYVELWHGDCREVLAALDLTGVHVAIVDPPYGETSLEWDRWVPGWPALLATLLPETASMWCFGSLRLFMAHCAEWSNWRFAQEIVWEKHNGSGFQNDRFKRVHELAAHWYRGSWSSIVNNPVHTYDATARQVRRKTRPTHMGEIERGSYQSEDGGPRLMRSVQYVRGTHGSAVHPTQKPEGIIRPLIEANSNPDGLVIDPFAGSGTTGVVAKSMGRRAILVEVDERYCEEAALRLGQEVLAL